MPVDTEKERRAATSVAKRFRPKPILPDSSIDRFDRFAIAWNYANLVPVFAEKIQARGFPINVVTSEVSVLDAVDAGADTLGRVTSMARVVGAVESAARVRFVVTASIRSC